MTLCRGSGRAVEPASVECGGPQSRSDSVTGTFWQSTQPVLLASLPSLAWLGGYRDVPQKLI